MERLLCILLVCASFGTNSAFSNKAFRSLNAKVNHMKASFQREIDDLKFEVLDLRTELEAKTARIEELLNETGAVDDNDGRALSRFPTTAKIATVPRQQSRDENDVPAIHVLDKAFQDLKHDVKEFQSEMISEIEDQKNASTALRSEIDELKSDVVSNTKKTEANAGNITETHADLQGLSNKTEQVKKSFGEEIDALKNEMTSEFQKSSSEIVEMQDALQNVAEQSETNADNITELREGVEAIKTEARNATLSTKQALDQFEFHEEVLPLVLPDYKRTAKCLKNIRAGGEDILNLLYPGVTVKTTFQPWFKAYMNPGGYYLVKKISHRTVFLQPLFGSQVVTLQNVDGFLLEIVEDNFDFSKCPA